MKGLGKKQQNIARENKLYIRDIITDINLKSSRFASVNDVHRITKINKESIRNHIKTLLKENEIMEFKCHNNSRGFIFTHKGLKIKDKDTLRANFYFNTEEHINSLKFGLSKSNILKKIKIKSSRDYGSLTERKERQNERKRLKSLDK